MYPFSRAIYREISPLIDGRRDGADRHAQVLRACEGAIERLATDRHYFARPTRSLFSDIRIFFPMSVQPRVYQVVATYMDCAQEFLARHPFAGAAVSGKPLQCRATTRKGTACQRVPLPQNGYCPSHQHLAETEDTEQLAA